MIVATVTTMPDSSGLGYVLVRDQTRPCWFDELRLNPNVLTLWPVLAVGSRVRVADGGRGLVALWILGVGTPRGVRP